MSTTLSIRETTNGGIVVKNTSGGQQAIRNGSNNFPNETYTVGNGNATGQANLVWSGQRTVANASFDNINLSNGSLFSSMYGNLTFATVKRVLAMVVNPDGNLSIRIGPQAQTHAAALWFGNTTASSYETVNELADHKNSYAGWPIVANTTDVLSVSGVGNVTYFLLVIGTGTGTAG